MKYPVKFNKMFTKPNLTNAAIAGFQVAPGIAVLSSFFYLFHL